jgi:hypothetical protein
MGLLKRRFAFVSAVIAVGCFALVAGAQTPPPAAGEARKDAREERKEERKDAREERKEDRKDAREERKDAREEAREERKEAREDRKERIEDLRQTRQERRREYLKKWREKWGDLANKPNVKAEAKVHARRMARLYQMRRVAEAGGKTELMARIDRLIEREKTRHTAALEKFKAEGARQ